jgi:hypothetical protein
LASANKSRPSNKFVAIITPFRELNGKFRRLVKSSRHQRRGQGSALANFFLASLDNGRLTTIFALNRGVKKNVELLNVVAT